MLCEVGFAADNGQPIVGLAAFSFDSVNYEARARVNTTMSRLRLDLCARAKHPDRPHASSPLSDMDES